MSKRRKFSAYCWQQRNYKVTAWSSTMTHYGKRVWVDALGTCFVLWRVMGHPYFYELTGQEVHA